MKLNVKQWAFLSLTFDLKAKADALTVVSILHLHRVGPTVLLLCTDQGENTQVPAQNNNTIPGTVITAQPQRITITPNSNYRPERSDQCGNVTLNFPFALL